MMRELFRYLRSRCECGAYFSSRSRRQKIVLVIAAAYGLLLIFLTLFSSQVLEASLPEVSVYYSEGGYISGEYFESIVPEDCLRYDAEGSYMYLLVTRDTPLGERMYVRRQSVKIQAISDGFAAVTPVLERRAAVVRESERELESGGQVRMR